MKYALACSIFLLLFGCSNSSKKANHTPEIIQNLPTLVNFPTEGKFTDTPHQIESLVYPLDLEITANTHIQFQKSLVTGPYNSRSQDSTLPLADSLVLYVDVDQPFSSFPMIFDWFRFLDVILPNDSTSIPKDTTCWYQLTQKFPLFIYNPREEERLILWEDAPLRLIQEAKDEKGHWRPIEFITPAHPCEPILPNYLPIPPKGFLVCGIERYQGNFRTQLRVKMRQGDHIYYSNPFWGFINKEQLQPYKPAVHGAFDPYLGDYSYID